MAIQSEPVIHKASTSYVLMLALVAAIGGFLFGFDTAVINGAVAALGREFQAGSVATGFAVSSALLGSAAGAFFAGQIADRYGRVKTMIVAAVLFLISAVGSGIAFTIWDFMVWRLVGGVAVGAASVIAPAYIAKFPLHTCADGLVLSSNLRSLPGDLRRLAVRLLHRCRCGFRRSALLVRGICLALDVLD